jgi:hypothetical protein
MTAKQKASRENGRKGGRPWKCAGCHRDHPAAALPSRVIATADGRALRICKECADQD